ncbi:deoxyribodipyrimidine photo-lyase [Epibacterium sp. SM1979]|uniref:Deoxyribodipyrimidine photo-lyase n=1 Tax=Tritonibacter litoralis TaxID=2662264 RepID=A0A843YD86_9RHOB|nr:deoxyribodipyrimidine photo-lyase [Tritonibacter litoralis]MQQ07292.1 deoxyribodipyrimidine photo-lyase [Tritonibacter litoralis]
MSEDQPIIWWIRRDLRLSDNPVLHQITREGRAVLPVYICDPAEDALGAAPQFRLGLGLAKLAQSLKAQGLRLIVKRGDARSVLSDLAKETQAHGVYWSRLYDPASIERDTEVKTTLRSQGVTARSFGGRLLFEPWTVQKKSGGFFQVYTPFWRAVSPLPVPPPLSAPSDLRQPMRWPNSLRLEDLDYDRRMHHAADVVASHCRVGEELALARAETFVQETLAQYDVLRDVPGQDATSGLSENLAWGEISPRQIWAMCDKAPPSRAVETFRKELVWREFSYHLMYHTPHILTRNWREGWDAFPWTHEIGPEVLAWQRGQTGIDLVDAGMRELLVTGKMHNRVRMVSASYLCKHLMAHWKTGMDWFENCLVDWDPAANAMGWQWVAGCGPDAAPFFRIFNPDGQRQKFDPAGTYCNRWIAEGQLTPASLSIDFFKACPKSWTLSANALRPDPVVNLTEGRNRALAAYQAMKQRG